MASYDTIGRFYDAMMGDRKDEHQTVLALIRNVHPQAQTLLELGCGTGSALDALQKHYRVSGLDLSQQMLQAAKRKLPGISLAHQDMVTFRLSERYDVICCLADSINHVLRFEDWEKLFKNVRDHLSDGGIFIFDMNTQDKLDRYTLEPPWVCKLAEDVLVMKGAKVSRNISSWNIRVFEHTGGVKYTLHEESIQEISFPIQKVAEALRKRFRRVLITDPDRRRPSLRSDRVYFTCSV